MYIWKLNLPAQLRPRITCTWTNIHLYIHTHMYHKWHGNGFCKRNHYTNPGTTGANQSLPWQPSSTHGVWAEKKVGSPWAGTVYIPAGTHLAVSPKDKLSTPQAINEVFGWLAAGGFRTISSSGFTLAALAGFAVLPDLLALDWRRWRFITTNPQTRRLMFHLLLTILQQKSPWHVAKTPANHLQISLACEWLMTNVIRTFSYPENSPSNSPRVDPSSRLLMYSTKLGKFFTTWRCECRTGHFAEHDHSTSAPMRWIIIVVATNTWTYISTVMYLMDSQSTCW